MNTGDVSETIFQKGHTVRRVIWKGTVAHFRILFDYQNFSFTNIMKFPK